MANWLEQKTGQETDMVFGNQLSNNLKEGLRYWTGRVRDLAKGFVGLLRAETPEWLWWTALSEILQKDCHDARPVLEKYLKENKELMSSKQRGKIKDEIAFWCSIEPSAELSETTGSTDTQQDEESPPWRLEDPKPWAIVEDFFGQLDDEDKETATYVEATLGQISWQEEFRAWHGRELQYVQGLRIFALEGSSRRQAMALIWLAKMPAQVGRGALNRGELVNLLDADRSIQWSVLGYIAAQRRNDMLPKIQEMVERTSDEVLRILDDIRNFSWTDELSRQYDAEIMLQHELAATLGALDNGVALLVRMATQQTHWRVSPGRALASLAHHPQQLETTAQEVLSGHI